MKYALTFGLLAGLVVIATMVAGIAFSDQNDFLSSATFGYLVMLVALSFIFVGVKRYRDIDRGGIVRFGPAFGVGLGIAAFAGVAYVIGWEMYLAATDYAFMDEYIAGIVKARKEAGVSVDALAKELAKLDEMRVNYAKLWFRVPMTFLEIFPVGLLVSLVSALLLRNPKLLPARR